MDSNQLVTFRNATEISQAFVETNYLPLSCEMSFTNFLSVYPGVFESVFDDAVFK